MLNCGVTPAQTSCRPAPICLCSCPGSKARGSVCPSNRLGTEKGVPLNIWLLPLGSRSKVLGEGQLGCCRLGLGLASRATP